MVALILGKQVQPDEQKERTDADGTISGKHLTNRIARRATFAASFGEPVDLVGLQRRGLSALVGWTSVTYGGNGMWNGMWNYDGGASWFWMGSMMVLFWGGVILLAIWAIRAITHSNRTDDPAMDTLRRRLAAGEISVEEFQETNKVLGKDL